MRDVNRAAAAKRACRRQNIERQQPSAKGSSERFSPVISTADIETISDLHAAVKQKIKNFHPKLVPPAPLRAGAAPRRGGRARTRGAALMRPPDSPADGGGGRTPRRLFAVRFIAANGTDRATGDEKLCAIRKEPHRSFRSICFNAHSTRRCFRGGS